MIEKLPEPGSREYYCRGGLSEMDYIRKINELIEEVNGWPNAVVNVYKDKDGNVKSASIRPDKLLSNGP